MPRRFLAVLLLTALSLTAFDARAAIDPARLSGLKARSIGPAGMSGRIAVVEGLVSDPNVFYVGAATGGLWKSTDGGLTWEPIFDDQPVHSIGAMAVNQQHPDIIWVGTGEANIRNSVSLGNGVYRSLDGGHTWQYLGLPDSERISRIRLDPANPDGAWVAVMGRLWGDSPERGVYRTTDGGKSWERVLYVNERTGCADLEVDPVNPEKLFAAMYDFRRTPSFFESGGRGSGLYVTHDGGRNWTKLTPDDGLPDGKLGRMGVAIAPSDPRFVYAFVEATENGFYRSTDGGRTWKNTGARSNFGNRPFYYADVRVDPDYPDRVYSLWTNVSVSDDGGATWRTLVGWGSLHSDHHAMWINPKDGRSLIEGNDGGVGISTDRGETWRFVANLPLAQFYHIAVDMDVPYHVYGGLQDNGSWRGPAASFGMGGLRNFEWQSVGWGDGFNTIPWPRDSRIGYSMSQGGELIRWNLVNGERRQIKPAAEAGDTLRFNWNAGLAIDPFNPETVYLGSQYLHRSSDRGESWIRISPDLTTDNPAWQNQNRSGGLTPDVSGAENYTTIIAIAPSRKKSGVIWVGTDDGRVQLTRDGGGTWASVEANAPGVPASTWVPHICASPHDPAVAFVVFDDHRRSNNRPYVYRVDDDGRKWTSLVTPDIQGYCLTIEQDPVDPNLLFLGTEFGLFVSLDGGRRWMRWTHGLPTCSVMALAIHPRDNDLVLGTHGRSVYVLDDITPLRTLSDAIVTERLHLFDPPPVRQYRPGAAAGSVAPGVSEFRGENRPYGALITFHVNDDSLPHPDDRVERVRREKDRQARLDQADAKPGAGAATIKPSVDRPAGSSGGPGRPDSGNGPKIKVIVRNSAGRKIREFERPVVQGLNRIVWELDTDPYKSAGRNPWDDEEGGGGGPEVTPGEYQIILRYKGAEARSAVQVLADPRIDYSTEARLANFEARQRIGRLGEAVATAVERLEGTRKDLEFFGGKVRELKAARDKASNADSLAALGLPAVKDSLDQLSEQIGRLQGKVRDLDKRLRRPRDAKGFTNDVYLQYRVNDVDGFVSSTWDRPSANALEHLARAEELLRAFMVDFNRFYAEDLPPLDQRLKAADLPVLKAGEPLVMPE